jgi:2,3,4,5-tetrahydropyridine-2-carboxylate N-succinyltransferase
MSLKDTIETLFAAGGDADRAAARQAFATLQGQLSAGEVRSAEPDATSPTGWRVNTWVKQGILLGFRFGDNVDLSIAGWPFYDKDTMPLKRPGAGVRIVPGGSSVREGAFLGKGVICMPPMYINIGAYVGEGTLVDSHALVGSCAQIGARVHLSAGAQIGGVIEPVGAMPVIVEDEALVGGNTGLYEGAIVKRRAVIAAGTVLTGLVRDEVLQLAERRNLPEFGGEMTTAAAGSAAKPGPEKPCIPRCAPGSECHNGKCSATAQQPPPPAPTSKLVNTPEPLPPVLFFAGSPFLQ